MGGPEIWGEYAELIAHPLLVGSVLLGIAGILRLLVRWL